MINKQLFLSEIPTRQLLSKLNNIRGWYWDYDEGDYKRYTSRISKMCKGNVLVTFSVTQSDLIEELSKREHIPNKKESKEKRQYLAFKYRKGRSRN